MLNGDTPGPMARPFPSSRSAGSTSRPATSRVELGDTGAMRYANDADTSAIVLAFAIGDGPHAQRWRSTDFEPTLSTGRTCRSSYCATTPR